MIKRFNLPPWVRLLVVSGSALIALVIWHLVFPLVWLAVDHGARRPPFWKYCAEGRRSIWKIVCSGVV